VELEECCFGVTIGIELFEMRAVDSFGSSDCLPGEYFFFSDYLISWGLSCDG